MESNASYPGHWRVCGFRRSLEAPRDGAQTGHKEQVWVTASAQESAGQPLDGIMEGDEVNVVRYAGKNAIVKANKELANSTSDTMEQRPPSSSKRAREEEEELRMPELAIGTALPTFLVEDILYKALKCGYRHIDTATRYASMSFTGPENVQADFVNAIQQGMRRAMRDFKIPRSELWITLKGQNPDVDLQLFGFDYVDCYIPQTVGQETVFASPNVRFWGAENISPAQSVPDEITIIQIQANRESDIEGWIRRGRSIQLFSAVSALNHGDLFAVSEENRNMIVEHFLTTYVRGKGNTLIVGSQTGSSLEKNVELLARPITVDVDTAKTLMTDTVVR